jgi:hypothetical protein
MEEGQALGMGKPHEAAVPPTLLPLNKKTHLTFVKPLSLAAAPIQEIFLIRE